MAGKKVLVNVSFMKHCLIFYILNTNGDLIVEKEVIYQSALMVAARNQPETMFRKRKQCNERKDSGDNYNT